MTKRSSGQQVKARRECFDKHKHADDTGKIWLTCHICGYLIDPAREPWEADHVLPVTFEGSHDPENVKPAHYKCHLAKTKQDVARNAKAKRIRDKHHNIRRSRGFSSKYRKRMDGTVILK